MTRGINRMTALAAGLVVLTACNQGAGDGNNVGENAATSGSARTTLAAGVEGGGDTRFRAALQAAGLDRTLGGQGPYTVLAPSDAAFAKLPAGAADRLMKDDARPQLTEVLTYHILPGTVLSSDITKAIQNGGGKAVLATMAGGTITATQDGGKVVLTDSAGTRAVVTAPDEEHSNGVIHHIDAVLMPPQAK